MGRAVTVGLLWLTTIPTASAIQPHGQPEGYLAHQFAHGAFLIAMGYLLVRLVQSGDVHRRGWRDVAAAALLFGVWNADAMLVHYVVDVHQPSWPGEFSLSMTRTADLSTPSEWMIYLGRMDSLLAVPALAFLYRGLGAFIDDEREPESEVDEE